MFSAMRRRLHVSPATVIAGLALVFAMTGGAYAAKKYLITSTKQISPSVLKSLQGKAGAAGANGAQGPAGPAGPQGPAGKDGANGASGEKGTNGAPGEKGKDGATGKSVVVSGTAGGCAAGGSTVTVEGSVTKHEICNGEQGPEGEPGAIHPGETLPHGASETGAWSYSRTTNLGVINVTAGFPIPLSAAPTQHLIYSTGKEVILSESTFEFEEVTSTACKGTAEAPTAEPGNFCMYVAAQTGALELGATKGNIVESNFEFSPSGSPLKTKTQSASMAPCSRSR